jgi:hypothetical protein
MNSFADFKKRQDELNSKLLNDAENEGKKGNQEADDRFWYPSVDQAGNGYAVVRFLPAPPGEENAFTKLYRYSWKNEDTGRWYIENSPTTIGKDDPFGEHVRKMWAIANSHGDKEGKHIPRRKTDYFFNVYVIKDQQKPENEGKVKLMKGGNWVWNKIKTKLIPEFEGEESVPVFDFWNGADFRIKINKKGDHRNYDRSEFDAPSQFLDGDDAKLEEIWNQQYSLEQFIKEDNFKSFDDLEKRVHHVLGVDSGSAAAKKNEEQKTEAPKQERAVEEKKIVEATETVDDDDEDFFARLAEDDDIPF